MVIKIYANPKTLAAMDYEIEPLLLEDGQIGIETEGKMIFVDTGTGATLGCDPMPNNKSFIEMVDRIKEIRNGTRNEG